MDKRRQRRTTLSPMMAITLSRLGQLERAVGVANDISENGIGVISNIDFSPGTLLELFLEEPKDCLVGEVRWCAADAFLRQTYHLGIMARSRATT